MPRATRPWLRPLLALDSEEGAAAAWAVAQARTGDGPCAVSLLHAPPSSFGLAWYAAAPGCPAALPPDRLDLDEEVAALLRRVAAGLPGDLSVTTLCCQGRRAPAIAEWARRRCADGVVVACGGERLVRRLRRELDVEVLAA